MDISLSDPKESVSLEQKLEITNAVHHCVELLQEMGIIDNIRSTTISNRSKILGETITKRVLDVINNRQFVDEEEVLNMDEIEETDIMEDEREESFSSQSTKYEEDSGKESADSIPFEVKLKAVKLAELHPKWTIKSIARYSTRKLKTNTQLKRWKVHVAKGGSIQDKYKLIDSWVYDRFIETREKEQPVTTHMLRQWAMAAANQMQCETFNFKASNKWINNFKSKHKIS